VSYREKLLIDLHIAGLRHIKAISSLFLYVIKLVVSVVVVVDLLRFCTSDSLSHSQAICNGPSSRELHTCSFSDA